MYEAQLPSDWSYIINDSQAKVLFCANQTIYDAVIKDVAPSAPTLQSTMCFDGEEGEQHVFATAMDAATEDVEGKLIMPPSVDDLASLIYTSGEFVSTILSVFHVCIYLFIFSSIFRLLIYICAYYYFSPQFTLI